MVYADAAATTKLYSNALRAMLPYLDGQYHNPSAVYPEAVTVRRAIGRARSTIARALVCQANEVFFTSGGTEANNWAIKQFMAEKPAHIITSSIEHKAVINACKALEKMGWAVTYLPVSKEGFVSTEDLEAAMQPNTRLVSIMLANNEVGTIEPIKELAAIAHNSGALFHTDAVQAVGHIPVNISDLGVDFLSLSAHKFGGPKGLGALFVKGGRINPLIDGGGQEMGRRSGTENTAGIIGASVALEHATAYLNHDITELQYKRDKLVQKITEAVDGIVLTGAPIGAYRLPGHASFVVDGIDSETLVMDLALKGVCVSAGSACTSSTGAPSYVLKAMGYTDRQAWCSLRITLDTNNTLADTNKIAAAVISSINAMRKN